MELSPEQPTESPPRPILIISTGRASRTTSTTWLPGDRIVTSSSSDTVRIWNSTDGTQVGTSMESGQDSTAMVVSKNGRIFAFSQQVENLIEWSVDTQESVDFKELGPYGPVERMALSPNEELLATCHEMCLVFWEITGAMEVKHYIPFDVDPWAFKFPNGDPGDSLGFSPDSRRLAVSANIGFMVFDVETGESILKLGGVEDNARYLSAITWSLDGARLFCAYVSEINTCKIRCFRCDTGEPAGEPWVAHIGDSLHLRLSPDGKCLASANRTIRFWDARSWNPVGEPLPHESNVLAFAFSPSGEFLASADLDGGKGRLHIWRVPSRNDDDREALQALLDMSAVVSPDASGPSTIPNLDFLDTPEPRRPALQNRLQARENPSRDSPRVQQHNSALRWRWWNRVPRLVFNRVHAIYPGYAEPRAFVAPRNSASDGSSDSPSPPSTIVVESSSDSSTEESSEDSGDTPAADIEVGRIGCCGLFPRRQPGGTAASRRQVVPQAVDRTSRGTRPRDTIPEPSSMPPVSQEILELSAIVRSNTP